MEFRTDICKGGRIVLPAKIRKVLEIQAGDELVMQLENGSIRIIPLRQAVNLAQKAVRQ
jgi:AbrB family looped-hinge helix DNA binding protein